MTPARRAPLTVVMAAAVALATACGTQEPAAPQRPSFTSYVALGDSYTSGLGIAPDSAPLCGRSARNYPHLLARSLGTRAFVDASCGASATADLLRPQRFMGRVVNRPQAARLSEETDLVTIGLGLNDARMSYFVLIACLPGLGTAKDCAAVRALTPTQVAKAAQRVARATGRALDEVQRRAPDAEVVLVGYPSLGGPAESCPDRWPVPADVPGQAHALLEALDEALESLAEEKGIRYADTFTASLPHGICAKDPWVVGARALPGRGAAMHPTDRYHVAVAKLLEEALAG